MDGHPQNPSPRPYKSHSRLLLSQAAANAPSATARSPCRTGAPRHAPAIHDASVAPPSSSSSPPTTTSSPSTLAPSATPTWPTARMPRGAEPRPRAPAVATPRPRHASSSAPPRVPVDRLRAHDDVEPRRVHDLAMPRSPTPPSPSSPSKNSALSPAHSDAERDHRGPDAVTSRSPCSTATSPEPLAACSPRSSRRQQPVSTSSPN